MSNFEAAQPESGPMLSGPLSGMVVVSLAINVPGPVTAARCTALGASVTTVLPPSGDPLQQHQSDWFDELHEGQKLITLDLKHADGLAHLHTLLDGADLLITASRRAGLARLGLDPQTLRTRHPRLCHVAIVGHPISEPEAPGHDLTFQAVSGLVIPPALPATLVADMAGAERATAQALALLLQRERTGVAESCEVALSEMATAMAEPAKYGLTAPGGPLGGGMGLYGIYETAQGWVALAAVEPHFAHTVLTQLGVNGSQDALARVFLTRTASQWQEWATLNDVPLVAVHTIPAQL